MEQTQAYKDAAFQPSGAEADAIAKLDGKAIWAPTETQKTIKSDNWKAFEAYLFMAGCDEINMDRSPRTLHPSSHLQMTNTQRLWCWPLML